MVGASYGQAQKHLAQKGYCVTYHCVQAGFQWYNCLSLLELMCSYNNRACCCRFPASPHLNVFGEVALEGGKQDLALARLQTIHHGRNGAL